VPVDEGEAEIFGTGVVGIAGTPASGVPQTSSAGTRIKRTAERVTLGVESRFRNDHARVRDRFQIDDDGSIRTAGHATAIACGRPILVGSILIP